MVPKATCRRDDTHVSGKLHRYLEANGVNNLLVDSASIEVNRLFQRAKTDRL